MRSCPDPGTGFARKGVGIVMPLGALLCRSGLPIAPNAEQWQSIEAGAAFRSTHEHHGSVEITEISRQHEGWQRDATCHLATGRTGEAIGAYGKHGMVHAAETRIILTHTNGEVRILNGVARDRMRKAGVPGDDVRISVERGARHFAARRPHHVP